ncbi:hypothetical protein JOF41_007354 [Saccharothrix coeruleofusca]|uniref:hypothetical protein n=1 Tax=Saccharothrix coeruleofusca TaxID=33919 RepID=UPI001AE972B6|nr:hypothetical protein [Saccharothrix coeruleofusca]MBP2341100.1 hypothetical protein [Saccharothrix coeruleofusca]
MNAAWLVVTTLAYLIGLTVERWLRYGWLPVHSEHEPLDFASLTIAGIPIEELGLPDEQWRDPAWQRVDLDPFRRFKLQWRYEASLADRVRADLADPRRFFRETS